MIAAERETPGPAAPLVARILDEAARATAAVCLVGLALPLLARLVLYRTTQLPESLARAIALLLQSEVRGFHDVLKMNALLVGGAALLVSAIALKRRLFRTPVERRVALAPWAMPLVALLGALDNFLYDADPYVAAIGWATLALHLPGLLTSRPRIRMASALAIAAVLVAGSLAAPSRPCILALAVWGVVLVASRRLAMRSLTPSGAAFACLALLPLATFVVPNLAAYGVPGIREHSPRLLDGRGYAYSFCELPANEGGAAAGKGSPPQSTTLYAAMPAGNTGDLAALRNGYVAEYDPRDFTRRAEHRFFDDHFYGGLRQLLCWDDEIQLTMNGAMLDGIQRSSNVMRFRPRDPHRSDRSIFEAAFAPRGGIRGPNELLGHLAAWDPDRDAVYYVSEWSTTMYRLDRKSGAIDFQAGLALPQKVPRGGVIYGYYTRPQAIHRARRTLYISEWADGSRVFEVDLDTDRVRRTFDTGDSGSFGLSVDEGLDRLVTSGLWGITAIDLRTGDVIARRRTGPGARTAILDDKNDLVLVGTTFGGHIWVFDRPSLRPLGRVTTGLGGREPYLTRDGKWLLGSDQSATWRWDEAEIAASLRR